MEIKVPHNFTPRPYQLKLMKAMDNGNDRAVICWHRRAGKDKTCFNYMVSRAMRDVGTYYYFMPTGTQAKKAVWDNIDNDGFKMLDHIPKEVRELNKQEMKITLVNGSIIQLIASDQFQDRAVGTNPRGVVFSEYSITDPQAWDYVRPILALNNGWAIFNYTPRGTNHAYQIHQVARDNGWYNQVLSIEDTVGKEKAQEIIERERREGMPEDLIEQEYYCKYLEGASQFFRRVDINCTAEEERPVNSHRYQIGVDLAKSQDYTVISVFDLMTFRQVYIDRFNQMDYNLQKAKIEAVYERYNKGLVILDATGVGEPIYDDLVDRGIKVEPFKFTTRTRNSLLSNLSINLQQDRIKLLDNDTLKTELNSFTRELTNKGKMNIKVPDGKHDDTVFATALSVFDLPAKRLTIGSRDPVMNLTAGEPNSKVNVESYE